MKEYYILKSTLRNIGGSSYKNTLKVFILLICSLSFVMMTGGKCNTRKASVYYNVTFVSNGGSVTDNIRVLSGSKVVKPTDPTRNNYTFEGWYSDPAFTQVFDFNTAITKNTTLYAKWKLISNYTVTFNSNGGSNIAVQMVAPGNKANKPTDPTRNNYTFEGWYSDPAFTQVYDFNTVVTANITLYAKWQNIITVSFAATVIGMREFLLTATATDTGVVSFIVSESATAPAWADVNSKPAKLVRRFSGTAREIYFSATDKFASTNTIMTDASVGSNREVNLSTATNNTQEKVLLDKVAPGVLAPGSTYYVYAYNKAGKVVGSQSVTTIGYPDTTVFNASLSTVTWTEDPNQPGRYIAPPELRDPCVSNPPVAQCRAAYQWNMCPWRADGVPIPKKYRTIEIKIGEVALFPLRYMTPACNSTVGKNFTPCAGNISSLGLELLLTNGSLEKYSISINYDIGFTSSNVDNKLLLLRSSPQLPILRRNYILDGLWLYSYALGGTISFKICDLHFWTATDIVNNMSITAISE